ncbi:MAG: DUF302 domain-containing protein [Paracoccaceae bacterium]|nr:DUF302 domain-containing protein [Paracoccaceae bacterium]
MRCFFPAVTIAMTVALLPLPGATQTLAERPGWRVIDTEIPFATLIDAVKAATKANKFGVVTEAGPTAAAASLGVTIPGNRVIGVFNPKFAIRILPLSTAAMIEAPIRFYVTEDSDGSGTLAWKTPSFVFAPYLEEGGAELTAVAAELDTVFEAIGTEATAK